MDDATRLRVIAELLRRSIGHGTRKMKDEWMREALKLAEANKS